MAYIEREKVIEVIKNFAKGAISDGQKALDPVDDIVLLCQAVDMIPPADIAEEKHAEWISVNKQLPETYIEVLVCFKADGTNIIAFVNRFGKWKNASTDNFIESEITHWMPLPEPPKGVMKK